MPARYAPLPNPRSQADNPEDEMEAAFEISDDEDDAVGEGLRQPPRKKLRRSISASAGGGGGVLRVGGEGRSSNEDVRTYFPFTLPRVIHSLYEPADPCCTDSHFASF